MGDGDIDFTKLLSYASEAGAKHMYVEQGNNYIPNDMACVEKECGVYEEAVALGLSPQRYLRRRHGMGPTYLS